MKRNRLETVATASANHTVVFELPVENDATLSIRVVQGTSALDFDHDNDVDGTDLRFFTEQEQFDLNDISSFAEVFGR